MNDSYLAHYGVLGMKWGVRRYENKTGSYTKKGVSHVKSSIKKYDDAKETYKTLKKNKDKTGLHEAKINMKEAKKNLNYNYKQLKNDYRADVGKDLYRSGKTITDNKQMLKIAGTIASGAALANQVLNNYGYDKYANYAAYAGVGLEALTAIMTIKGNVEARYLRAYYAHSAKYK